MFPVSRSSLDCFFSNLTQDEQNEKAKATITAEASLAVVADSFHRINASAQESVNSSEVALGKRVLDSKEERQIRRKLESPLSFGEQIKEPFAITKENFREIEHIEDCERHNLDFFVEGDFVRFLQKNREIEWICPFPVSIDCSQEELDEISHDSTTISRFFPQINSVLLSEAMLVNLSFLQGCKIPILKLHLLAIAGASLLPTFELQTLEISDCDIHLRKEVLAQCKTLEKISIENHSVNRSSSSLFSKLCIDGFPHLPFLREIILNYHTQIDLRNQPRLENVALILEDASFDPIDDPEYLLILKDGQILQLRFSAALFSRLLGQSGYIEEVKEMSDKNIYCIHFPIHSLEEVISALSILDTKEITATNYIGTGFIDFLDLKEISIENTPFLIDYQRLRQLSQIPATKWICHLPVCINLERQATANLSLLSNFPHISQLNLRRTLRIENLSLLQNVQITELNIQETAIHNLSFLAAMNCLKDLDASRCPNLADVSGLSNCIALEKLDLSNTSVFDPNLSGSSHK